MLAGIWWASCALRQEHLWGPVPLHAMLMLIGEVMTPSTHQRARAIVERFYKSVHATFELMDWQEDKLVATIAAALEEEIEACAKVAEESEKYFKATQGQSSHFDIAARHIAAAIRSRSKHDEK